MTQTQSFTGAFTRGEGKDATFEVGRFAPLAGGSITARMGDTVVLVTATGAKTPREGADFFPLTVDVAIGKRPPPCRRADATVICDETS